MIAGILPWRADFLKKPYVKPSEEERLLKDGWLYANSDKTLEWRNQKWTLMYKAVDNKARPLKGFPAVDSAYPYRYIEFMAISHDDKHAELYAYGNFIKGEYKPYLMQGRQIVKLK
jgi:hypothetical protein